MKSTWNGDSVTIFPDGRIDSNNAAEIESEINEVLSEGCASSVTIDAEKLEYISSAGLRVLLRIRKKYPALNVFNVRSDVYDIFEMTGFTEMMNVRRAYKSISIEGAEIIGSGGNGSIYRIDQDNVVKVYNDSDALAEIEQERKVAKLALILGIPTAISYDVVKVGDTYGSVFEMLNARPLSRILAEEPDKFEWCVSEYVEMLKRIHGTLVPEGRLPDMKETVAGWAKFVKDYLPAESGAKLISLVEAVPYDDHMLHGDYHTNNLMLQDDEVLLIDMDTLTVGYPVFEFGSMYNAFRGFSEMDHDQVMRFQGFDYETAYRFWRRTLELYLGTDDEAAVNGLEDKARIIGYTRLIRRSIRRGGLDDEKSRAEIDHWKEELLELLSRTDTLEFERGDDMNNTPDELDIEAVEKNLNTVIAFVDEKLETVGCSVKSQIQVDVAVEEIFVNIAKYAYNAGHGRAIVRVAVSDDPVRVTITFIDKGVPYDPLAKEDPDVTLSAAERKIGGLGIFMVKKSMDDVSYEYRNGQNILTLVKNL